MKSILSAQRSLRLICPSMMLPKPGEVASSKSPMNTLAPEFKAFTIILRSTGPVISTRRSRRSAGTFATFQSPSRIALVSGRKSGVSPASKRACRAMRAARSSLRRASNFACSPARKARASGVRISSKRGPIWPVTTAVLAGLVMSGSFPCVAAQPSCRKAKDMKSARPPTHDHPGGIVPGKRFRAFRRRGRLAAAIGPISSARAQLLRRASAKRAPARMKASSAPSGSRARPRPPACRAAGR